MIYPYSYKNNILVIEISDNDELLSELNIKNISRDILDLNTHLYPEVILDLSNKRSFNSSNLAALIKIKDILFDEGIEIILQNMSDNIRELLKIVGLSDSFRVI
jgi:anti-anti-sigma regulatory factor